MWLAFFFLLRLGEYTLSGPSPHPFRLCDVRLWHHQTPIDPLTAPPAVLLTATFVVLIFNKQKSSVRGETVGHGLSGNPYACPVKATIRRVLHLRSFNAPPTTPLCAVDNIHRTIQPSSILAFLRQGGAAHAIHTNTEFQRIHLKALRATGASALLSVGTDYTTIKLLGRWKSDSALRYLHLQNNARMSTFAPRMLAPTLPPSA
jgi:hypothetical protein